MLVLVARAEVKPESLTAFLEVANGMLAPSRAEAGCYTYDFYSKPDSPTTIVFVEEWTDQAALDFHFATPHFQNFAKTIEALVVNPPAIRTYEVSSHRDL